MGNYEINTKIKSCPVCSGTLAMIGDKTVMKCMNCKAVYQMREFSHDDRHMICEKIGGD